MPKLAAFKLKLKLDWLPRFSDWASALHGEASFIIAFVGAEHW